MHDDGLVYREVKLPLQGGFTREWNADGVTVTGTCPRCHGETSAEFKIVRPSVEGIRPVDYPEDDPTDTWAADPPSVICACGFFHDKRPETSEETGCGAVFKIGLAAPETAEAE